MGNMGCVLFVARALADYKRNANGLRAIEVGSLVPYGGYRSIVELHGGFAEYVGVDIQEGPGVEVVCDAGDLVERFGGESFDVVIATELIEHVKDWRNIISNLKAVCRPDGIMVLTTRSKGFGYHGAPFDYWRYEPGDILEIFSDCELLMLEEDLEEPGVFATFNKPAGFLEKDLSEYCLYNIIANSRVRELNYEDLSKVRLFLSMTRAKLWQFGRWFFSDSKKDLGQVASRQIMELAKLSTLLWRKGKRGQ